MPFSPLAGALPERCAGLYIGGGCPERHAGALAAQRPLLAAVRAFAAAGGVVYAEGAGLVFLSQSLQPAGGAPTAMGARYRRRARPRPAPPAARLPAATEREQGRGRLGAALQPAAQ